MGAAGQGIVSVGLGRAVLDGQLEVVERSSSAVAQGVNSIEVKYFDNAYHVFGSTLTTGKAHLGEAINYATSADGVRWTEPKVILSPGSAAGFNDWGLSSPTAAVEAGRLVLFYTAFGSEQGDCVLQGAGGRFGLPYSESKCVFATTGRAVSARRS